MFNNYLLTSLQLVFKKVFASVLTTDSTPTINYRAGYLNNWNTLLGILKYSTTTRANMLVELTVCDFPSAKSRFQLAIFLLSIEYNYRVQLNAYVKQSDFVPSLSNIYVNSGWSEREVRDMFGLYFTDNVDLRRLLTDYGFDGFPLRKDFPLTGYFEARYDDELQQILYEPLQLSQELRLFDISSPWEKKK